MKKLTSAVILDMNGENRRGYSEKLKELGIYITLATDEPIECLKCLRDGEVDILIMDMVLQGIDGLEFVRTVRSFSPQTVIIVCTHLVSKHHAEICSQLGVERYVVKPVKDEIFSFIVAQYIDNEKPHNDIIFQRNDTFELNSELLDEVIQNLNLPFHIKGTLYTKIAIKEMLQMKIPLEDILITKDIYPHIAKVCNTTVSKVERNIRYCIDFILTNETMDYISPDKYGVNANGNNKLSNGKFLIILAQHVMDELCCVLPK